MEITEVRVRKVNSGNRVKAIAQITFDNEFVVHEIKVMEKPEGLFIAMPRRKKGERYYDIAHPINQEVRDKLTKAVLEKYEEDWKKIIPRDNATPHILLLRLFDQYDEKTWVAIKSQTQFHKLTYKFSEEKQKEQGTYYRVLLGEQA